MFCAPPLFWDSNYTYMRPLDVVLQLSGDALFFPHFIVHHFYCYAFKFPYLFLLRSLICHWSYPVYFSCQTLQFQFLEVLLGSVLYIPCLYLTSKESTSYNHSIKCSFLLVLISVSALGRFQLIDYSPYYGSCFLAFLMPENLWMPDVNFNL